VIVRVVEGAATSELRREVLRPNWAPGTPMHGDDQPEVLHLAVEIDGSLVGACALFPCPYPRRPTDLRAWQLRGMATAPRYRGGGVGTRLVAAAIGTLEARGAHLLWCEARASAIGFYAGLNFVGEGELYTQAETGIEHRLMYRELFGLSESSISQGQ
jgi:ribosomal protein S18 acetylase RimI-like enzyme